jgi:LPS sulfotransferase NodH
MPTENARHAYFVCATPRTGSSLLLGLLDSTGVCGHPQAYFRAPDEPHWADRWQLRRTAAGGYDYVDYLRAARAAGSTPNGMFGAKLMWGTMDELVDKLRAVHPDIADDDVAVLNRTFGRIYFIYLRREDVLAQAVSWLRAEQTNTWFIGGNGEVSGNGTNTQTPAFDAAAIRRFMDMIEDHNTAWEAWFASRGIQPHRVSYEDLEADTAATTRRILTLLGVPAPETPVITARHRRQADELNQRWIKQYQATTET